MNAMRTSTLRLPLLLASLCVLGCGGHGPSPSSDTGSTRGAASLTVAWPARTARLIPNAANSLVVTLSLNGAVVATKTVARPTGAQTSSTAEFEDLPYGTLAVAVAAFPTTDGSGVAQAVGAGSLVVAEGSHNAVPVSLASTVAALAVLPASVSVPANTTLSLTASATDEQGRIVLLSAGGGAETLTWTSADPSVASVAGAGPTAVLAGTAAGTTSVAASIRVDDGGGTKSVDVPVSVVASSVVVVPFAAARTVSNVRNAPAGLQDGTVITQGGTVSFAWRATFPLDGVPAAATIVAATLRASVTSTSSPLPTHRASAYPATEGGIPSDASTTLPAGAVSAGSVVGEIGPRSFDATAAVKGLIAASAPYAGFQVGTGRVFTPTIWSSPTLTIVYTLP